MKILLLLFSMNLSLGLSTSAFSQNLEVKYHTASEAGFLVNSHLIYGPKSVVLVDAQFTRSEAKKVVKLIKESGKNLTSIFITHAHPDHYLGLEVISKEFPEAKVLARPSVIQEIKDTAQGKIDYWKAIYKDDLADTFVLPSPYIENYLSIDSDNVQIQDFKDAESASFSVLYIPATETLLTGDLAYNQVHLWLAENRPDGWLKNLEEVKKLGPISHVFPGHGAEADASLLEENSRYIRNFMDVTKTAKNKEDAAEKLKALYPAYRLPIIADLSVAARM